MPNLPRLKLALQKKGRLRNESLRLLQDSGIDVPTDPSILLYQARQFPIDILFVRDDDIPTLVATNICDVGIVGDNVVSEKTNNSLHTLSTVRKLGFCECRLSLAVANDCPFSTIYQLNGKRIATSYPNLLAAYLQKYNIAAEIVVISGSVEIAPRIGMADAICDLVSTGKTLRENQLTELTQIMRSEAILIKQRAIFSADKNAVYQALLQRIDTVLIEKLTCEMSA